MRLLGMLFDVTARKSAEQAMIAGQSKHLRQELVDRAEEYIARTLDVR